MAGNGGKRVTVYDIADSLKLSASTVSRVLNRSTLVSDGTRDRILETADRLGYRKRIIRKPVSRSIATVRLLVPFSADPFLHLFYDIAELLAGIREGFSDMRVNIITELNDGGRPAGKKPGDIDGVICAFTEPDGDTVSHCTGHGIPLLLLNRESDSLNYITYDGEAGMERLVRETASRHPEMNPCYVGFSKLPPVSGARFRGVATGCGRLGIPFSEADAVFLDSLDGITADFLRGLKRAGKNAIFAFNDATAVYLYGKAVETGYRIPGDFSLTGFDCSPVRMLVSKRIDTILLSARRLGREAGTRLRTSILHRNAEPVTMKIPGEYVSGDTI